MKDLEKLSDRELDCEVAEKVMGWSNIALSDWWHDRPDPLDYGGKPIGDKFVNLIPSYSTDDNAARLVRDRIAELGLDELFTRALVIELGHLQYGMSRHPAFPLIHATPRQQCIAALMAQAPQTASSTKGE